MAVQLRSRIMQEEFKLKEYNLMAVRINDLQAELETAKKQENPFSASLVEDENKLSELKGVADDLTQSIAKLQDDKAYYDYWVDGLSNGKLKSYIMESVTPILNERANYYSKYITGGEVTIEISTQTTLKSGEIREKFSVNTTSTVNNVDYEQSSGGQRRRVDICILLALHELVASRTANPLKLMIVDELAENIDDIGVDRLLELLNHIADDKSSLFYVTHNENLQSLFPKVITVVLENGVSTIQ
jgi:DNA repair exonuclease SbcCD ATPase subunit